MASEQEKEAAFLRRCLVFTELAEGRQLRKRITDIKRDQRSLCRAMALMVLLAALAVASLVFGMVLAVNFNERKLLFNLICSLLLTGLTCLGAFAVYFLIYQRRLNGLRAECFDLVAKLLGSRQDEPFDKNRQWELIETEVIALRRQMTTPASETVSPPGVAIEASDASDDGTEAR
jgi:hypothetical protein